MFLAYVALPALHAKRFLVPSGGARRIHVACRHRGQAVRELRDDAKHCFLPLFAAIGSRMAGLKTGGLRIPDNPSGS